LPRRSVAKAGCLKIESVNEGAGTKLSVMPGLDPGIHDEVPYEKPYV
jgi:hypothetical protein